jgi:hypothetical protein
MPECPSNYGDLCLFTAGRVSMKWHEKGVIWLFALAFFLGVCSVGCSGPTKSMLSISPISVTVLVGSTQQFNVAKATNTSVIWRVNATVGGNSILGTISASGLYTPPATVPDPPTVKITAVSAASSSASAMVNLAYPSPTVASVSPGSVDAASAQTIMVTGTNFTVVSKIQFGATPLPTTFLSSTQLTASLAPTNTALAGSVAVSVMNPTPGGGASSPVQLLVTPVLSGINPSGAAVGTTLSIAIAGGDPATPRNNAINFTQAGQTITVQASSASAGGGVGTVVVMVVVPTGLIPATASSDYSAPSTVTVSVGGIPATGTKLFSVQPPPHAVGVSPTSAEVGTTLGVVLIGAFTAFTSSSTVSSDNPGLSVSDVSVSLPNLITATIALSNGVSLGDHTLTVTSGSAAIPFQFTALPSSTVPVVLTGLSANSVSPLAPITLTGSGFTAGGQSGSSVVLRYSYADQAAELAATPVSSSEIDSFLPVLSDPITGSLYVGQASVQVVVDGRSSGSQIFSITQLPANSGPIGATTTALIARISAQLSTLRSNITGLTDVSSNQAAAIGSLLDSSQTQLENITNLIQSAASGHTVIGPNGSMFTADTVDLVDRLLQSSNEPAVLAAAIRLREAHAATGSSANTASAAEAEVSNLGMLCKQVDGINSIGARIDVASVGVCFAGLIPSPVQLLAVPLCAILGAIEEVMQIYNVGKLVCNLLPINLTSIVPQPASITLTVEGPSATEVPSGSFGPSPTLLGESTLTLGEQLLHSLGKKALLFRLISNNKTVRAIAVWIGSAIQLSIDNLFPSLINPLSSSVPSIASIPLTSDLAPLQSPFSLVTISDYDVAPGSMPGMLTLYFDLSRFRLLDLTGEPVSDSLEIPGNIIPVTVGLTQEVFTGMVSGSGTGHCINPAGGIKLVTVQGAVSITVIPDLTSIGPKGANFSGAWTATGSATVSGCTDPAPKSIPEGSSGQVKGQVAPDGSVSIIMTSAECTITGSGTTKSLSGSGSCTANGRTGFGTFTATSP